MKEKKYLKFYEECMENDSLPESGLCMYFGQYDITAGGIVYDDTFVLLMPTTSDKDQLVLEDLDAGYWASGLNTDDMDRYCKFTPLRQTIVLFMAAMNDEL